MHEERARVFTLERQPASEQPERHAAEGVDVASSIERPIAGNQFGRKKCRSS